MSEAEHSVTAPAGAQNQRAAGFATQLERCAALLLCNRFLWLAGGISLFMMLQLSLLQLRLQRFNTLDLVSHLMVLLEAGLLASALINILSIPRLREAYYRRWPGGPFSHTAAYSAALLVLCILLVLELLPLLWLHRYPGLIAQGIHIPLMLLQRGLLLLLSVLITGNLVICLRLYLRLPAPLCAIAGILLQVSLGYYITWLSFSTELFRRLNSVFYYNQLWHYLDKFPNLQRPEVVHNMQDPLYAFFGSALILLLITTLMWLPKASQLTAREKPG